MLHLRLRLLHTLGRTVVAMVLGLITQLISVVMLYSPETKAPFLYQEESAFCFIPVHAGSFPMCQLSECSFPNF